MTSKVVQIVGITLIYQVRNNYNKKNKMIQSKIKKKMNWGQTIVKIKENDMKVDYSKIKVAASKWDV